MMGTRDARVALVGCLPKSQELKYPWRKVSAVGACGPWSTWPSCGSYALAAVLSSSAHVCAALCGGTPLGTGNGSSLKWTASAFI